jgi:EamA-like transporter family protein
LVARRWTRHNPRDGCQRVVPARAGVHEKDVAAVLAFLYPVTTVVLARIVLEEQIRTAQWAGAVVCLAAVVLITI